MKTSDFSFTDATGVEWWIVGESRICGASYVDCWSADNKAVTIRPKAYLIPAGLAVPTSADILPEGLRERHAKYHVPVIADERVPEGVVALVKDGVVLDGLVEDENGQFHFVGHE